MRTGEAASRTQSDEAPAAIDRVIFAIEVERVTAENYVPSAAKIIKS